VHGVRLRDRPWGKLGVGFAAAGLGLLLVPYRPPGSGAAPLIALKLFASLGLSGLGALFSSLGLARPPRAAAWVGIALTVVALAVHAGLSWWR
jgi:hypothetical protein